MAANTCNQPPFRGNGTGAVADYVFGFEYINRADVEVYVGEPGNWTQFTEGNAANANEYQWQNDTTIRLNAATGTDNVLITRETDRCDPAVEFFAGTSIRAEDLNANQEQTLLLIQELSNTLSENGMDQPPGSDGITLDDLEDVEITTPANPSWLRWNGTQWEDRPILEDGDPWVSDDEHIVTSEAGDDRWLQQQGGGGGTLTGGDMINVTGATISVDLAAPSGLESTNPGNVAGELRINTNDGCEIVAAGLNAETTAASIVQTGGTDADPAIRISTTLGVNTTNTDLQIVGGANTNVTRNNAGQLTIDSSGGTGLTYRGTVDVTDNATLPANSNVNDVFANDTEGTQTANWQTVITGASTTANQGDLLLCTTAAGGTALNARYTLIESGTPAAGNPNLEQVTTQGNTTTQNIVLQTGANVNTNLNSDGSAGFNTRGQNVDFVIQRQDINGAAIDAILIDADADQAVQLHNTAIVDQTLDATNNSTAVLTVGQDVDGSGADHFGIYYGNSINPGNNGVDLFVSDGNFRIRVNGAGGAPNNETVGFINGFNDNVEMVAIRPDDGSIGFIENDGTPTNYVRLRANAAMANDLTINLPTAPPTAANRFLAAAGTGTGNEQTLEWTAGATGFVQDTGDTMTGNLQMDGASVIADNGENVPDANGNWDIQNSNVWQVADGRTIEFPDNTAAPIPGQTGIFVCAGLVAGWTDANGGTWEHPAGAQQPGDANGAIIPFYVQTATNIILGTQTVGS